MLSALRNVFALALGTLGRSATQLILDHMHLVLIELFVHHGEAAGDDEGNGVVTRGIEFLYESSNEAFQEVTLQEMIKMNAGELMQAPRAQTHAHPAALLTRHPPNHPLLTCRSSCCGSAGRPTARLPT